MNKNILTITCCATLLLTPVIAYSAETSTKDPFQIDNANYTNDSIKGMYVSAGLGLSVPNDLDVEDSGGGSFTLDNSFALGGAIGYKFKDFMRIEGEVAYQKNDLDNIKHPSIGSVPIDGDTTSTALLLNVYTDFMNDGPVFTFLSIGAGMAKVEANVDSVLGVDLDLHADDTDFAYQLGAGVGYVMSENVVLELKYRYFAIDVDGIDYSTQNVYLTTRIHF
jgi:opacity protein-like surface antigen